MTSNGSRADAAPVLIMGATGGVGSALARRHAAAGAKVHLAGRDAVALEALAAELNAPATRFDALEPDSVAAAAAAAGPALAGLVWAVGSIVLKPLKATRAEDLLDAFRLNALGAALAVRAAQPALAAGQGAVVLFSTVAVAQGFPNHAAIAAAKGAVEGLTRALAAELAPTIRVNCVAPSLTETKMAAPLTGNPQMAKAIAALHPIPRLGSADEIAAAAEFLLDPIRAGWITGHVLPVDGGRAALRVKG